jgi:adenine phosphoribosyltransferase
MTTAVEFLKSQILDVPDFPKPGVMFRDISPVLADGKLFDQVISMLLERVDSNSVDMFAGIESRGFILASAMATKSGKGFLPIRKAGKLPPPVISESYALEYGTATIETKHGSGRVVLVDDVLATGGTLAAAKSLCVKAGFTVVDSVVLIDLLYLASLRPQNLTSQALIAYS